MLIAWSKLSKSDATLYYNHKITWKISTMSVRIRTFETYFVQDHSDAPKNIQMQMS